MDPDQMASLELTLFQKRIYQGSADCRMKGQLFSEQWNFPKSYIYIQ